MGSLRQLTSLTLAFEESIEELRLNPLLSLPNLRKLAIRRVPFLLLAKSVQIFQSGGLFCS